ncbi:MAG: hypothetical protein NVS3B20_06960 [Polyangiales bacterium]
MVIAIAAAPMWFACKRSAFAQFTPDAASGSASLAASATVVPLAQASAVPRGPSLASIQMQTWIQSEPRWGSAKLGYLRAGAIVARSEKSAGNAGCAGGWYAVKPFGYVCIGEGATLDAENPIVKVTGHRRPDLEKPMPYRYGFIRAVAPQYLKVPTKQEQLEHEFKLLNHLQFYARHEEDLNATFPGANDVPPEDRGKSLVKPQISPDAVLAKGKPKAKVDTDEVDDDPESELEAPAALLTEKLSLLELFGSDTDKEPIPWWLVGDRAVPQLSAFVAPKYAVIAGRVKRHTGLALIDAFTSGPESDGRKFAITTDLRLVPVDKLKPNVGSQWHGVDLSADFTLPIAFAYPAEVKKDPKSRKSIKAYTIDGSEDGTLFFRQAIALTGKDRTAASVRYFETKDGRWLRKQDIIIARKPDEMPPFAKPGGGKWIDLSVLKQTLILWEGDKPVYATLVSTGQDGIGDPKTTKSTVRGTFRIRDKHVTTTMDANDVGNKFELRDVPWVQYFEAGYALHAAYWHDVYGTPRSHGCVNMSPIDARKVFFFTDPPLPPGWHGVLSADDTVKGTVVFSHI